MIDRTRSSNPFGPRSLNRTRTILRWPFRSTEITVSRAGPPNPQIPPKLVARGPAPAPRGTGHSVPRDGISKNRRRWIALSTAE